MAHGYMRDYDEDRGDGRERWRDDDRERGWRGGEDSGHEWRGSEDRERWRGNEPDRNDRNLSFMLGDRDRSRDRGDWERAPRNFSSHQDDHYRSWRDRQMQALDEFTTTLTLCFTPEHLGMVPHYTSPPKNPTDFADFARYIVSRYAPQELNSAEPTVAAQAPESVIRAA